eukprot:1232553-Rhodomonas_salina.1
MYVSSFFLPTSSAPAPSDHATQYVNHISISLFRPSDPATIPFALVATASKSLVKLMTQLSADRGSISDTLYCLNSSTFPTYLSIKAVRGTCNSAVSSLFFLASNQESTYGRHPSPAMSQRGDRQILDLEETLDHGRHGDALSADESQELVVVEHSVHALDPQRVHRAVHEDPLEVGLLVCARLSHQAAQGAVSPLSRNQVVLAEELPEAEGFGVHD